MTRVSFAKPREMVDFDGERCTPWVTTPILSAHMHRYVSVLDLCRGQRVLDIASGEGYGAAMLIRNGATSVTGAEIDPTAVERANRVYDHPGLLFQECDIRQPLPFPDDAFDVAVSFETIEHIAEHESFLDELARVLSPTGTLVISTPDKSLSDPDVPNPFHARELDEPEFLALIRRNFATVDTYHQGYHYGSVVTGVPGRESRYWQRSGFLDYDEDGGRAQRRYIIAVASNGDVPGMPVGMLHDGFIVASLNKRIRELEDRLAELEASGNRRKEG